MIRRAPAIGEAAVDRMEDGRGEAAGRRRGRRAGPTPRPFRCSASTGSSIGSWTRPRPPRQSTIAGCAGRRRHVLGSWRAADSTGEAERSETAAERDAETGRGPPIQSQPPSDRIIRRADARHHVLQSGRAGRPACRRSAPGRLLFRSPRRRQFCTSPRRRALPDGRRTRTAGLRPQYEKPAGQRELSAGAIRERPRMEVASRVTPNDANTSRAMQRRRPRFGEDRQISTRRCRWVAKPTARPRWFGMIATTQHATGCRGRVDPVSPRRVL